MKRLFYTSFSLILAIFFITSCEKNITVFEKNVKLNLPDESFDYVAAEWQNSNSSMSSAIAPMLRASGVTNPGATLGRVLFYDTQLSLNNRISCASCHSQEKAFADGKKSSIGFENKTTPRNSMAIVNPILNNSLFWDSRAESIENLVSEPISNHIEMGMESMEQLATKLGNVDFYGPLFKDAFGNEAVTEEKITDAMSQFLRSMVSLESKFDVGASNEFVNYTAQELRGQNIFFSKDANCSSCHSGVNFSAPDGGVSAGIALTNSMPSLVNNHENFSEYAGPEIMGTANIGLDVVYADNGFGNGQFKIPTLRNIEFTGPYMHDGRYETLEEVVEHYSTQIKLHENLDDKFIVGGQAKKLNLSDDDKSSLVAFLKTLSDTDFVSAERFSDPFVR